MKKILSVRCPSRRKGGSRVEEYSTRMAAADSLTNDIRHEANTALLEIDKGSSTSRCVLTMWLLEL